MLCITTNTIINYHCMPLMYQVLYILVQFSQQTCGAENITPVYKRGN